MKYKVEFGSNSLGKTFRRIFREKNVSMRDRPDWKVLSEYRMVTEFQAHISWF
jgi:hypothetical protein